MPETTLETFAAEIKADLEADTRPADELLTVADMRNLRREIINAAGGAE